MKKINMRTLTGLILCLLSCYVYADTSDERCHYKKTAEVPIQHEHNTMEIQGGVDDHAILMRVDTGAFASFFSGKAATRMGLTLEHSDHTIIGVGGESTSYFTMVKDLALDKIHLHQRLRMLVVTQSSDSYDFTLGADILFGQDLEISTADNRITFFQPGGCSDTFLGYWGHNVSVTRMLELSPSDHRQVINVEVNGQQLRALIDTGASKTVINLAAAARLGITPDSPDVKVYSNMNGGTGDRKIASWIAPFDHVTIADETIKNPKILIIDLWGAAIDDANSASMSEQLDDQPEMILGMDFITTHRILFARSQRLFYFSYLGGNVFGSN